jgi:hypothetical protein
MKSNNDGFYELVSANGISYIQWCENGHVYTWKKGYVNNEIKVIEKNEKRRTKELFAAFEI